jgi:glucose-1-phosphate thymidylyltransferase
VLAGGSGTRLRPLTYGFAKQMIPVANKPVLFYSLQHIKNSGIVEVIINVAPHSMEDLMSAVGDGSAFGLEVKYSVQKEPMGIAHAVKIAQPLLEDDAFVVYLGDNILKNGIDSLVASFSKSDVDALALVSEVPNPERFGTVEVIGNKVVRLVEKPKVPTSNLAMVGVYFLKPIIFDSINRLKPSLRNELEIVEAYQDLVDRGFNVEAVKVDGWWADTGTTEDLLEANRVMLDDVKPFNMGEVMKGASVKGAVSIGAGSKVHANCKLIGPSIIGEDCEIGPDTVIGPYASIGDGSRIARTTVVNSIIMENAKIALNGSLRDSIIGNGAVFQRTDLGTSDVKAVLGQQSSISLSGAKLADESPSQERKTS